jgi:hypothetical protein
VAPPIHPFTIGFNMHLTSDQRAVADHDCT